MANPHAFILKLRSVQRDLNLSTGDLALWLARPRGTVYSWLFGGHVPVWDDKAGEGLRRLRLLEHCPAFPVPYGVTKRQRRHYIQQAYAYANAPAHAKHDGVPAADPSP